MSMEALAWAMKQPVSPLATKAVLIILADKANGDGECWPSIADLKKVTGVSERMVRYHITALADAGYVCAEQRGRAANLYRLALTGNVLPVEDGNRLPLVEIADRQSISQVPAPSTGNLFHSDRQSISATSLLTQKNPKTSPSAGAATRVREELSWLHDLYRLGWADNNRLDDREVDRIVKDYGQVDIASEVEKFVSYWRHKPKPPGNWNTYLRLRTWLGKAKNGFTSDRRTDNKPRYGRIPREPGDLSFAANA